MSRLDMGLQFTARTAALVFMWAALISAIIEGFKPAFLTELLLWVSLNCFIWYDIRKGR